MIWGLEGWGRVFQVGEMGYYIIMIIIPVATTNNENFDNNSTSFVAGAVTGTSH